MPTQVRCTSETVSQLRLYAQQLLQFTDRYKELTDSYVVEFFVKRRWDLFPESWHRALSGLSFDELAELLLDRKALNTRQNVWPLSLLAYSSACHALSLDPTPMDINESTIIRDPTLKPIELLCRLHVKAKKRHEILRMAEVINSVATKTGIDRVVDVGSGHGHLSRLLSFGCGLKVTSIEAVGCHLTGAAKVDTKIKTIIQKRIAKQSEQPVDHVPHTPPQHVECTVHPQITVDEFLNVINNQSNCSVDGLDQSNVETKGEAAHHMEGQGRILQCEQRQDSAFILAGLHTCGDLAPTMLRVFSKCAQARALTSVACCYMKMECAIPPTPSSTHSENTSKVQTLCNDRKSIKKSHPSSPHDDPHTGCVGEQHHAKHGKGSYSVQCPDVNEQKDSKQAGKAKGYPMSDFVQSLGGKGVQFEAMELACHSLPSYRQRLKDRNPNLVLHGYRATLEILIQEFDYEMTQSHASICKIKKAVAGIRKPHLKTFEEYATTALTQLGIPFDADRLAELGDKYRPEWNNVMIFHVLRIMMGPIVESLFLVDRVLYLHEQGIDSKLVPLFDAALSPRNFALVAVKES